MTQNSNTDRITGLSFDTHYAALLVVGGTYAATFDGKIRTVVRVDEHPTKSDHVRIVWSDTPTGKCNVVPMGKRYFIR